MSLGDVSALDSSAESGGGGSLPADDVFDILSNPRRRYILHYLKCHEDRRVGFRELVEGVAAWENDTTVEQLGSDERKRVYTALRQSHLDRMDNVGVVDYDADADEVALTEQAREVELYLERVPERDIPWSEYYLGLSGVGAALVAATWMGASPFSELSGLTLAAIIVGVFAASAAVHTYRSARNRIGSDTYEIER